MNSLTTFLSSAFTPHSTPKMTNRYVSNSLPNRSEIDSTISTTIFKSMAPERFTALRVLMNSVQRQSQRLLQQCQMYHLRLQKTFGSVTYHVPFLIQNTMRLSHGHRTPNPISLGINSTPETPLENSSLVQQSDPRSVLSLSLVKTRFSSVNH